jgi:hypothetical protein
MTTNWALPTQINQYAEPGGETAHITWLEVDSFYSLKEKDGRHVRTTSDLIHIARDPRRDITQKTYYLKLTGFNFQQVPDNITGIEMMLSMNRHGRITDDTIQLCLSDNLIGDNLASIDLSPKKIYGGDSVLWNTSITKEIVQDPLFGVVLRFQSHPDWPHKSSPLIDAVELRIH